MTTVGSCRNQAAPLIGISCGRSETGSVRLSSAYTDAIVRVGGIPVVLPIIDDQALAERLLAKVDGVVEAYEYEHVLSVQFHPERLVQKDSSWLALFRYFIGLASPRPGR